jgi:SAM-dependent methyltransferase
VPHLPFDDKYFDFIYAGSVFTHIDDLATAWLCELRRILNPQGTAYITIHDKKTIELMNDKWFDHPFARLMRDNPNYVEYIKADFGMFAINRSVNSHIFYDVDYFCKLLQPLYEVVAIKEEAYAYQTEVSGKCRPVPRKLLESRGKDDKLRCL